MADKFGLTVRKNENFSEWYQQLCLEQGAHLADLRYGVQGFLVLRPYGFQLVRKIYELFEHAIEEDNHEPMLFPSVIPEENLQREKEHAGFVPEVFWITEAGSEKMERKVALRPTGEAAIYPMYSLWVRSYKDLPFKRYQSRITVFRNEMTTRPFLRGREFSFFETHDVFQTHDSALSQIKTDLSIMKEVIENKLMIPFYFFKRPKWDRFKGAEDTFVSDTIMPDGKRLQISSTHDLGTRFAEAYNVRFKDADGTDKAAYQTCFGPGIFRIVASLISIHGDDTGLVLPSIMAPLKVVIVPIIFTDKPDKNKLVTDFCRKLEKKMKELGITAKFDDGEQSPGYKFNQWEMMGVPIRLEVGPKEVEANTVTLVRRTARQKIKVEFTKLADEIHQQLKLMDDDIKAKALTYFTDNTKDATTMTELIDVLQTHRGFVKVPFCSVDLDGEKCADVIKAETAGAIVCGTRYPEEEKVTRGAKCIVCKKQAKHIVYTAKTY
ncbi:proline--tRNA ligase [Candidatus Woesearchaeota archaeon]|nr:proline--tRNA ligase [Candidatus Woesearchaeota archaeon]